jgi:hypothetical protein
VCGVIGVVVEMGKRMDATRERDPFSDLHKGNVREETRSLVTRVVISTEEC